MSNAGAAAVSNDPFWSVVRRRHPDLDIVVLPQTAPSPAESGRQARESAPFAEDQAALADDLWTRLVGDGRPNRASGWIPGPTHDSVRHRVTLTLQEVNADAGIAHLRTAAALLAAAGWKVFTPPTGMPRLSAERAGELGSENLLFGYAQDTGRLFLRLTSTGLPVGARRARTLIGATA